MQKKIFNLIILVIFFPAMIYSQSYNSLWKKVAEAQAKDLPETGIDVLRRISSKALQEKEYGHLLKAEILSASLKTVISPDSLEPAIERLEKSEQAARNRDKVLAAVYQSVLGKIYEQGRYLPGDAKEKSQSYFRKSLTNPDLLANTHSFSYQPLVINGLDSKSFNNDLLHVLGIETGDYRTLHDYYSKAGNRPAACLTALELLKAQYGDEVTEVKKSKYFQQLDSLLEHYHDLPEAGEVAIERYHTMENAEDVTAKQKIDFINFALYNWGAWERMNILRNAKSRLTLPSFQVSMGGTVQRPNVPKEVYVIAVCNIQQLNMKVWKLKTDGTVDLNPNDAAQYRRLRQMTASGMPVCQQTKNYVGLPDYKVSRDTMTIAGLPVGVYLVEFSTDNKNIKSEKSLLYVSDMFAVVQSLPGRHLRVVAVNATTGQPVENAKVTFEDRFSFDDSPGQVSLACDKKGEADYAYGKYYPQFVRVSAKGVDEAMPFMPVNPYAFFPTDEKKDSRTVQLYTDRSIYRPGQTVHVAVIGYRNDGIGHTEVLSGRRMTLTLKDADYRTIAEKEVISDEFGTAWADFILPSKGLTGMFSVRSSGERNASTYFSVEEYKRPTFEVSFERVTEKYAEGDLVKVKGKARSFSGVPVQGARVAYTVVRRPASWWRNRYDRTGTAWIAKDTIFTDGDGNFEMTVPMNMPPVRQKGENRFYRFDITAQVTDGSGESRMGETSLPLSDKATVFTVDLPQQALGDSLKTIRFSCLNNAGEEIPVEVSYQIDGRSYTAEANKTVALPMILTSGEHMLKAVCGSDTINRKFMIFSYGDKRPAFATHEVFHVSDEVFPTDGKPVRMMFGSSDMDVHVVYTIMNNNRVLESGQIGFSNAFQSRKFTYKEKYGNGLQLNYAWVKDGKFYNHRAVIKKPLPDRSLKMAWKTFRDRLVPGQKEEWTLQIKTPKGNPASAQLMAVLYDKSLELIKEHQWRLEPSFDLPMPYSRWTAPKNRETGLYGELPFKFLKEREPDFSHIDDDIMPGGLFFGNALRTVDESTRAMGRGAKFKSAKVFAVVEKAPQSVEETKSEDAGQNEIKEEKRQPSIQPSLRENFNETAFFFPALTADEKGNVELKFTLPESITTWRFMGLAHDKEVNHGYLEDEVVAKKVVMIQPNMPRFMRRGDKGLIKARLFNTTDRSVAGQARLELVDPETGNTVYSVSKNYIIDAEGTSTVDFGIDMPLLIARHPDCNLLTARVSATGENYSDGEQHFLPVLSDRELVTTTVPLTQDEPGVKEIDLSELFPQNATDKKLTIEYTNNPSWLTLQALPAMSVPDGDNAVSLAAAYYSTSISEFLLKRSPVIKSTIQQWQREVGRETSLMSSLQKNEDLKSMLLEETPWVVDAEKETDRKQRLINYFDENTTNYRKNDAYRKLAKLQNGDGSFSWWPGMRGSSYMTLAVTEMLTRLNLLVGIQEETKDIIEKGMTYLDKEIARTVQEMRKEEKKGAEKLVPGEFASHYLYINALQHREATSDIRYLVELLSKVPSALSIYGKASSAVILDEYHKEKVARTYLQSMKEHSVYKEGTGRYFDTPKALYSWADYRIPSQVAAIEALRRMEPGTKEIVEMQQWLLHEKRTTSWDTPINSVNATYAFLKDNLKVLESSENSVLRVNGKVLDLPKATAGLGYVKTTQSGKDFRSFTAEKQSAGTSWGAVYAQYFAKSKDVKASSSGLSVTRELLKDGKPATSLQTGDKVTVRITVKADRDYDFVQLQDKRAACMEPVNQLSGYRGGYYCSPKDNVTNYYFDGISKGRHVIETEYYIDRTGEYSTGICTVQCAYSPEFSAHTSAEVLTVKQN